MSGTPICSGNAALASECPNYSLIVNRGSRKDNKNQSQLTFYAFRLTLKNDRPCNRLIRACYSSRVPNSSNIVYSISTKTLSLKTARSSTLCRNQLVYDATMQPLVT